MCLSCIPSNCHKLIHQRLTIPTNATRELIETFQKNKIHCSTLLTEVLSLVNQMVEIEQHDDACGEHLVNEIEIAPVAALKFPHFIQLHMTTPSSSLKM